MSFMMYNSLKQQSHLYAAFKNSVLSLTCGAGMRESVGESLVTQVKTAKSVLAASSSQLTAVAIDPALLAHAKATNARLNFLQTSKGFEELPELFAALGDDDEVCGASTSEAIQQAVENGTPISLFAAGDQVHEPQWEGQLFLQFNPRMARLELVAFHYRCTPQPTDVALFDSAPRSKNAMRRLFELQARFQVSHVLRACYPLSAITSVSFGSTHHHSDFALLTLDVDTRPQFARRRVNSTIAAGNAWHATADWTKAHTASSSSRISFVGYTDVLQYLLSMMAAANERVAGLLAAGTAAPAGPATAFPAAAAAAAASSSSPASAPGKDHRAAGLEHVATEGSDSEGELGLF